METFEMKKAEDKSYDELKAVLDQYYTDWKMPGMKVFLNILAKYGVRPRNKDGKLCEITFSIPKTVTDGIVLSLRYEKENESYSEDLFLFELGKPIQKGYRGALERVLPEYKDTHKGEPNA